MRQADAGESNGCEPVEGGSAGVETVLLACRAAQSNLREPVEGGEGGWNGGGETVERAKSAQIFRGCCCGWTAPLSCAEENKK